MEAVEVLGHVKIANNQSTAVASQFIERNLKSYRVRCRSKIQRLKFHDTQKTVRKKVTYVAYLTLIILDLMKT